jgi:membrane protein implicated in regulation of membrane protease activity
MFYGFNVGLVVFWIAIVAIVIANNYFRARRESEKHETLRRIVDKTGQVDEARMQELFGPVKAAWSPPRAGGGYRALRILGTLVVFTAAGLAVFFAIMLQRPDADAEVGLAISCLIAFVGAGLFVASRFAQPPPDKTPGEPPAQ